MKGCCAIFSDIFSHRDNYLTRIDVRVKMVFAAAGLVLVLSSSKPWPSALLGIISNLALMSVRVPAKLLIMRLLAPFAVAAPLMAAQLFIYGEQAFLEFTVAGYALQIYREGLDKALLLGSKVFGASSLMVFLGLTCTLNKILQGMRYFGAPKLMVEITMFTYRYIFVFVESACNIRDAQRLRLGYSSAKRTLSSAGALAGALVTTSIDQAAETYRAMVLRGYKGEWPLLDLDRLKTSDTWAAAIFACLLIALALLNFRF